MSIPVNLTIAIINCGYKDLNGKSHKSKYLPNYTSFLCLLGSHSIPDFYGPSIKAKTNLFHWRQKLLPPHNLERKN